MREGGEGDRTTRGEVAELGRYRLIAELARGGMGIVYLALVRGSGGFSKLFVVKELKAHLAEDPSLVAMFIEEARLAAKLNHPNVVQTIEAGSEGDRHFIAMEYLDGQSLNRLLNRVRRTGVSLPLHYHLHVIVQLLEGLHYAHGVADFDGRALNLVHRDVSPHNVFVTYGGQVKVLDFGIAKALDSANETRTGVLKGKVAYMAPEQSCGEPIDRTADLFSVGVMLWEAAVGERMWSRPQNDLQILRALMNGAIPRPRDAKPDIDPALERIIRKATAPKAIARYASAAEFQGDLEAFLDRRGPPGFGARDVGKFLSDVFADERSRIKVIIDDQLRLFRGAASGEYDALPLPLLSRASTPSGTPSALVLTNDRGTSGSAPSSRTAFDFPVAPEAVAPSVPERSSRARGTRGTVGLLLLAGVASGVGVLVLRRPPSEGVVVSRAILPVTPPAPPLPASDRVRAHVSVSPPESRISIDGEPSQVGSATATFARNGQRHTIRVEAPHYQTSTLTFVADDDHAFDIALLPEKASAESIPTPSHVHPHAEARPVVVAASATAMAPPPLPLPDVDVPAQPASPGATAHARQQIDTHDPYAN